PGRRIGVTCDLARGVDGLRLAEAITRERAEILQPGGGAPQGGVSSPRAWQWRIADHLPRVIDGDAVTLASGRLDSVAGRDKGTQVDRSTARSVRGGWRPEKGVGICAGPEVARHLPSTVDALGRAR